MLAEIMPDSTAASSNAPALASEKQRRPARRPWPRANVSASEQSLKNGGGDIEEGKDVSPPSGTLDSCQVTFSK
jgi:hypothetical protein